MVESQTSNLLVAGSIPVSRSIFSINSWISAETVSPKISQRITSSMQEKETRREAARKFKETAPAMGVFTVRCTAEGRVWVGSSRNLNATRNKYSFTLGNGSHPDKSLQQEWNSQAAPVLQYEIVETLEEDVNPLAVGDLLKAKRTAWVARLGGLVLAG